jgi:hypothetical protein
MTSFIGLLLLVAATNDSAVFASQPRVSEAGRPVVAVPKDSQQSLFDIYVDGVKTDNDVQGEGVLADSVTPEFKITMRGNARIKSVDGVRIKFAMRRDKEFPRVYPSEKKLSADGKTFSYRVFFEEDSILYLGDTWVKFEVTDSEGKTTTKRIWFAVGGHVPKDSGDYPGFDEPAWDLPSTRKSGDTATP